MPLEIARFDRVFDIVPGMERRKPVTYFGFQFGAKKKYSIAAPGRPSIEAGMVVTAYLKEHDNWQTLVGWINHSNGELVVESAAYEVFGIAWCTLFLTVFLPKLANYPLAMAGIAVVLVAFMVWAMKSYLFLRAVRRQLSLLKEGAAPVLPSEEASGNP